MHTVRQREHFDFGGVGMRKRDLLIIGFVILLTGALVIGILSSRSIQTGSWGLSFRTEGAPPVGNAGSAQLEQYDAAFLGDPAQKVIYLTFDAGYENGSTEKILDTLKKQKLDLDINYKALTAERVKELHEAGIEVNVWTVDSLEDAQRMVEYGVDYITSNIIE